MPDEPIILQPGEFLLVVPSLRLTEIYYSYPHCVEEALTFTRAGRYARIWNWKRRELFPELTVEEIKARFKIW